MSVFSPSKLSVTYMPPATPFRPIDARKYTLTHSDTTGQLFLSIGCQYDYAAVNKNMRDEVLAEWTPQTGIFTLYGAVYVSGGEYDEAYARVRFLIFQKEMNLALQAIIFGDQALFSCFPWLLDSPIYIQFQSNYPSFNQIIYYGTPRQYLYAALQQPV